MWIYYLCSVTIACFVIVFFKHRKSSLSRTIWNMHIKKTRETFTLVYISSSWERVSVLLPLPVLRWCHNWPQWLLWNNRKAIGNLSSVTNCVFCFNLWQFTSTSFGHCWRFKQRPKISLPDSPNGYPLEIAQSTYLRKTQGSYPIHDGLQWPTEFLDHTLERKTSLRDLLLLSNSL